MYFSLKSTTCLYKFAKRVCLSTKRLSFLTGTWSLLRGDYKTDHRFPHLPQLECGWGRRSLPHSATFNPLPLLKMMCFFCTCCLLSVSSTIIQDPPTQTFIDYRIASTQSNIWPRVRCLIIRKWERKNRIIGYIIQWPGIYKITFTWS